MECSVGGGSGESSVGTLYMFVCYSQCVPERTGEIRNATGGCWPLLCYLGESDACL